MFLRSYELDGHRFMVAEFHNSVSVGLVSKDGEMTGHFKVGNINGSDPDAITKGLAQKIIAEIKIG